MMRMRVPSNAHVRCTCTLTHQFAVTARNNSLILSLSCNEQLAASGGTNSITLLLSKALYVRIYASAGVF